MTLQCKGHHGAKFRAQNCHLWWQLEDEVAARPSTAPLIRRAQLEVESMAHPKEIDLRR